MLSITIASSNEMNQNEIQANYWMLFVSIEQTISVVCYELKKYGELSERQGASRRYDALPVVTESLSMITGG